MSENFDLFGPAPKQVLPQKRGFGSTHKRGYAALPGSGPNGKTCRDCAHYRRVQGGARKFPKCGLMERYWTSGAGTDIRAGAPACARFELGGARP
jgi:hypothetical protein